MGPGDPSLGSHTYNTTFYPLGHVFNPNKLYLYLQPRPGTSIIPNHCMYTGCYFFTFNYRNNIWTDHRERIKSYRRTWNKIENPSAPVSYYSVSGYLWILPDFLGNLKIYKPYNFSIFILSHTWNCTNSSKNTWFSLWNFSFLVLPGHVSTKPHAVSMQPDGLCADALWPVGLHVLLPTPPSPALLCCSADIREQCSLVLLVILSPQIIVSF